MAAEQKARTTYDNILRLVDDPDVRDVIKFLREREVVHYQRFGEGLRIATDKMNEKNFYAFNPSFDTVCNKKNALILLVNALPWSGFSANGAVTFVKNIKQRPFLIRDGL